MTFVAKEHSMPCAKRVSEKVGENGQHRGNEADFLCVISYLTNDS